MPPLATPAADTSFCLLFSLMLMPPCQPIRLFYNDAPYAVAVSHAIFAAAASRRFR